MDLNPGVKKVAKDIGKFVSTCTETFKAVESLCADISGHLESAGELAEKLSRYVGKVAVDYADFFDHNKIAPVDDLTTLLESASTCLAELGGQFKKNSEVFETDLQRLFKFASLENQGLQSIIEQRNSFTEVYEEAKLALERKKASLMDQQDLRRWGIDPKKLKVDPQELLKNPSLARKYMLPQVVLDDLGIYQGE